MPDGRRLWKLVEFEERFEAWVAREAPSEDLSYVVAEWMFSRVEDPYEGAQREPGFPNLWSARIRGTADGTRAGFTMVLCSYRIHESRHEVECDTFAILNYPL